jgi:hypothetical protein
MVSSAHTLLQHPIHQILGAKLPQSAESGFQRVLFAPFSASFHNAIERAHGLRVADKRSRRCYIDPHPRFSSESMGAERSLSFAVEGVGPVVGGGQEWRVELPHSVYKWVDSWGNSYQSIKYVPASDTRRESGTRLI